MNVDTAPKTNNTNNTNGSWTDIFNQVAKYTCDVQVVFACCISAFLLLLALMFLNYTQRYKNTYLIKITSYRCDDATGQCVIGGSYLKDNLEIPVTDVIVPKHFINGETIEEGMTLNMYYTETEPVQYSLISDNMTFIAVVLIIIIVSIIAWSLIVSGIIHSSPLSALLLGIVIIVSSFIPIIINFIKLYLKFMDRKDLNDQ